MTYDEFLAINNISHEQALAISENTSDLDTSEIFGVYAAPSLIQGIGLFSSKQFKKFEVICRSRVNNFRTLAGRYVNHDGDKPNCKMIRLENGDMDLVAISDIDVNEELTTDYQVTMSENKELAKSFKLQNAIKTLINDTQTTLERIECVEYFLSTFPQEGDIELIEEIHGGNYMRTVHVKAGVILTGKIILDDHICILTKGSMEVLSDDGLKNVIAPAIFKGFAGTKKMATIKEDIIFTTIHRVPENTDLKDAVDIVSKASDLTYIENKVKELL